MPIKSITRLGMTHIYMKSCSNKERTSEIGFQIVIRGAQLHPVPLPAVTAHNYGYILTLSDAEFVMT